jgi:hypothetical protein
MPAMTYHTRNCQYAFSDKFNCPWNNAAAPATKVRTIHHRTNLTTFWCM